MISASMKCEQNMSIIAKRLSAGQLILQHGVAMSACVCLRGEPKQAVHSCVTFSMRTQNVRLSAQQWCALGIEY